MYLATYYSPLGLGTITLTSDGDSITGLWLEQQISRRDLVFADMVERGDLPVLKAAKNWLDRYFAGQKPDIDELPLAPTGTAFRQQVWAILREIPYGHVITYKDIAVRIAAQQKVNRMSCQAVGGAVGHNPISIIIPCHRVVGGNGSLTGYGGGIHLKVKLLQHEGVDMSRLYVPKAGTAL
ncbi:MAG: methylated-DNA--[protein]-cysteine S-methyltransferase [Limnochordia bacterium]